MEGLIINGEFVTAKSNGYVLLHLSFYHDINIIRSFPRITVPDGKLTAIFDTGISLGMFLNNLFQKVKLMGWLQILLPDSLSMPCSRTSLELNSTRTARSIFSLVTPRLTSACLLGMFLSDS